VVTAAIRPAIAPEIDIGTILYKNVTPYNLRAWHLALQEADLIPSFPNLVHDLVHSTPIGNLPPLIYTFIPNNFMLAEMAPNYMLSFLTEEISSGCMDAPFLVVMAHLIFKDHFRTSPLGFGEKSGLNDLHLI